MQLVGADVRVGDEIVVQQIEVGDGRELGHGEGSAGAGIFHMGCLLEGPVLGAGDAVAGEGWHDDGILER